MENLKNGRNETLRKNTDNIKLFIIYLFYVWIDKSVYKQF